MRGGEQRQAGSIVMTSLENVVPGGLHQPPRRLLHKLN